MPLVELEGFEEAVRRNKWTGCRLPVPYEGPRTCNRCGVGELIVFPTFTEHALFLHGGYGAGLRRTVAVCCACGRTSELLRESVRPPRKS